MVLEASDGSIFYNVNRIGLWQIAMLRNMPVAVPEEDMFHLRGISFNTLVAYRPLASRVTPSVLRWGLSSKPRVG